MNIEQIHSAFREVVNQPGVYNKLQVPKNNVTQYRWKLKRNIHISIDKKISVLQRAGYRMEQFEWTDTDIIAAIQFAIGTSEQARQFGPAYVFDKWKLHCGQNKGRLKR